jgi:hypothetical protein
VKIGARAGPELRIAVSKAACQQRAYVGNSPLSIVGPAREELIKLGQHKTPKSRRDTRKLRNPADLAGSALKYHKFSKTVHVATGC